MANAKTKLNLTALAAAPSQTEQDNAARTHRIIREYLESVPSLARYRIDTFLQGSYKNSTNVRQDSDVDIGSRTSEVYIDNTERLDGIRSNGIRRSRVPAVSHFRNTGPTC